jgi:YVTN family beta-propeller protein
MESPVFKAIKYNCQNRTRFSIFKLLHALILFIGTLLHTALAVPASSMDMVYEQRNGADYVYVANPDHDTVSVVSANSGNRLAEIPVGNEPRGLALDGFGYLWVTNKESATLSIISTTSLQVVNTLPGPPGSRPHGIVIDTQANRAYVVLEALGTVYQLDTVTGALINSRYVGSHPREISINDAGTRLYLPRFITAPVAGENGLNPANGGGEIMTLATSNLASTGSISIPFNVAASGSDTNQSARGIPNYLRALALSPDGSRAVLPAKIDNIHRGSRRDGRSRRHNMLTRGILATIDLGSNSEILSQRIEFVDNSHPTAVAYSPSGNHLYAVHEGSRAFEVINARSGAIQYQTTLGFAPTGVVVSTDGLRVFVHNWLSRTLSIIDTSRVNGGGNASIVQTVGLVRSEALGTTVLRGKRLFHDSADPRLSAQRYISCASCHDEGGQDGRVYDFSDVGEGLRNTADMRGRGDMEDGNVHWTANFDEIQDFESALREIFGGQGLMTDADFNATAVPIDPNRMKTGRSSDLDALAAFVDTLDDHGISPFRQANGSLTAAALRGRTVFENASCATCHSGSNFTDSPLGGSHNIGTIDANTGLRFGQPLINGGLDTPTLQGLWNAAPYLHDGGALTVRSAILAHTQNMPVSLANFSSAEIDDLANYVLQIDDSEPAPSRPP